MKIPILFKEYIWLIETICEAGKITFAEINENGGTQRKVTVLNLRIPHSIGTVMPFWTCLVSSSSVIVKMAIATIYIIRRCQVKTA